MELVPWRVLVGFMPVDQAVVYAARVVIGPDPVSTEVLKGLLETAIDHVQKLESPRLQDGIVSELPADLVPHANRLLAGREYHQHAESGGIPVQVVMADPSRLIVVQQWIDINHVQTLGAQLPVPDDLEGLFRFCLPEESQDEQPMVFTGTEGGTFTVVSPRIDFGILRTVQGVQDDARKPFLGFVLGSGLPHLSVVEHDGRFILRNGHHRAVALARAGYLKVPVTLLRFPSYSESGLNRPDFFAQDVVLSRKPPMVCDFLGPAAIDVPRRKLRTVVTVHAQVQHIPD